MSVREDLNTQFDEIFNRLVGTRVGKPITTPKYSPKPLTDSELNFVSQFYRTAKSSSGTKKGYTPSRTKSKLTEEQQKARIDALLKKSGETKKKGFSFMDVLGDAGNVLLDTLTLPQRTLITGPATAMAEQLNAGNRNPFELFNSALYGAGANLIGKRKDTFTDFFEETPAADWIANMPGGWQKSALGIAAPLAGEIITDPTTYLSAGATVAAKGAQGTGKAAILNKFDDIAKREAASATKYPRYTKAQADTIVDETRKIVKEQIEKSMFEVHGGARRGRLIGLNKSTLQTAADKMVQNLSSTYKKTLKPALKNYSKLKTAQGKLNRKALYPILNEWDDAVLKAQAMGAKNVDEAAKDILFRKFNDEAQEAILRIVKEIDDSIVTSPTLRLLGRDIAKLPGNLHKLTKLSSDNALSKMLKGLSYGKQFPGMTEQLARVARAKSAQVIDEIRTGAAEIMKGLSKEERKLLNSRRALTGPLRQKQQQLESLYKRLFDIEESYGLRPGEFFDPEYRYTHLKGRKGKYENFEEIKKYREGGQTQIKSLQKKLNKKGLSAADRQAIVAQIDRARETISPDALKAKVVDNATHIEEDAIKNLMAKTTKVANKIRPQEFRQSVIDMYGVETFLPHLGGTSTEDTAKMLMANFGLEDVTNAARRGGFTPTKLTLGAAGDVSSKLTVNKEISQVLQTFASMSAKDADRNMAYLMRSLDIGMSNWKKMQTIYSPAAFNVKGFVSDMLVGMMDDIGPRDYVRMFKAASKDILKLLSGKTTGRMIKLRNGTEISLDDMWKLYTENLGSSSLVHSDVAVGVRNATPNRFLKTLSERREDFGRFVHFLGAMEDEILSGASQAEALAGATYRVDKFKFDYGALTKWEQNFKRVAMPFYTFPRKAIPTIAQSLVTHPRTVATLSKMYPTEAPDTPGLANFLHPDFMTQQGTRFFGQGKNPWALTSAGTQLETIHQLQNPMTMMGPIPSTAYELMTGRDTFTGREIDTSSREGFMQALSGSFTPRLLREIQTLRGQGNKPNVSSILSATTGQKLYQVTDRMVESQRRALMSQMDESLRKIDEELTELGYSIFPRGGDFSGKIGVRDLSTGKVTDYDSRQEAIAAARKILQRYGK